MDHHPEQWVERFERRKRDHLRHAMDPSHQTRDLSGLDQVQLVHEALPDLDWEDIELGTPFYVAGMTAGHSDAFELNQRLALACSERGWAMGVGSQRRELEGRTSDADLGIDQWMRIRESCPKLKLFANLGASQVVGTPISKIQTLVESIQADALVVHLNALQEAMQPEGTPRFKGAWNAIQELITELGTPVILKETGCGFSENTLRRLAGAGLAAIDVSGLGGTHWGRIEGARAREENSDSVHALASQTFATWGVPTAQSVVHARRVLDSRTEIWASGGVRSGLDAAKLIALGAHRIGYAQPALAAAMQGSKALSSWMELQEYELKTALFCTGSQSPQDLRGKEEKCRLSS